MVLPCNPRGDLNIIKSRIREKYGVPDKYLSRLSGEKLCAIFTNCSDSRHYILPPMTPQVGNDGHSYLIDTRFVNILSINDYLAILSSSTELSHLKKLARRIGYASMSDAEPTLKKLSTELLEHLVELGVREPIQLPFKLTKKIQRQLENVNTNAPVNIIHSDEPDLSNGGPSNNVGGRNGVPFTMSTLPRGPLSLPTSNLGNVQRLKNINKMRQLQTLRKLNSMTAPAPKGLSSYIPTITVNKKTGKAIGAALGSFAAGFMAKPQQGVTTTVPAAPTVPVSSKTYGMIVSGKMPSLLYSYLDNTLENQQMFPELYQLLGEIQADVSEKMLVNSVTNQNTKRLQSYYKTNNAINSRVFQIKKYETALRQIVSGFSDQDHVDIQKIINKISNNKNTQNRLLKNLQVTKLKWAETVRWPPSSDELYTMVKNDPRGILSNLNINRENSYLNKKNKDVLNALMAANNVKPEAIQRWMDTLSASKKLLLKKRLQQMTSSEQNLKKTMNLLEQMKSRI